MKGLFLVVVLSFPCFANARQGGTVGNGGDEVGLEFQSAFKKALFNMKTKGSPEFKEAVAIDFVARLPNLNIVTVEQVLETQVNGQLQESSAMNFPKNQMIKINRERWLSIDNDHLKEGLALHEMLSLVGLEGSGRYPVSAKYVSAFDLQEADLKQNFEMRIEKAQYQSGHDLYSIEVRERWIRNPSSFHNVRFDYVVKKNGQVIPPEDNGGTMTACADNVYPLPDQFIQVLAVGAESIGFSLRGMQGCGNAYEYGFQLILPGKKFGTKESYLMTQISSKDRFVLQKQGESFQFWYVQEEGACGKSLNFYVPRLLTYAPQKFELESGHLPKDLSKIPVFQGLEYDYFAAFFVAGVKDSDWELMNLSLRYFRNEPDFIERNRHCELPTTLAEAQKKVWAMREISSTLKNYAK